MWILFAFLSAIFASFTTILSKSGVKNTNSDVAIAIRTTVVLLLSWVVVLITGEISQISKISVKSLIFLCLSGIATGVSWICYFKALSLGEVSKVSAVDKSSIIFSVIIAMIIFPAERILWWLKLIFLFVIGIGTFLMTQIKKGETNGNAWFIFAFLSAVFGGLTSILAKVGISGIPSNLATAIRTCVVLVFAWLIVFVRKEEPFVKEVPKKDLLFLCLSGFATAISWLSYYYAIAKGQVSVVVPIDKLSVLFTVIMSIFIFKEKPTLKLLIGLILLTAGTIFMVVFT